MSEGMSNLEMTIQRFETIREEIREATREGHSLLKQIRHERKEIERLLSTNVKEMVEIQVNKVVKSELDKISPEMKRQTGLIYEKVGKEMDKMITLCLGKELSQRPGTPDIRPALAAKLRVWLRETIDDELLLP